jgi:hypothetical protein
VKHDTGAVITPVIASVDIASAAARPLAAVAFVAHRDDAIGDGLTRREADRAAGVEERVVVEVEVEVVVVAVVVGETNNKTISM